MTDSKPKIREALEEFRRLAQQNMERSYEIQDGRDQGRWDAQRNVRLANEAMTALEELS
jgi:hypothetical protein